jgi:hypothetical protein
MINPLRIVGFGHMRGLSFWFGRRLADAVFNEVV